MSKNVNRRDFIKTSAMGTGGVLAASSMFTWVPSFMEDSVAPLLESNAERTPTVCEVCFWNCAGWVYKDRDGNIQKIIGNEDDPNSNGRLCPRGTAGVGIYNDPDRLKKPMMRVGDPGKQEFKEVEWDEAFDYIVKKMNKIKAEHGPEAMALMHHGTAGPHFKHLFKSFGSKSEAKPAVSQCLATREAGFINTYGAGLSSPEPTDVKNTKCLVLIGNHIGENMHNGYVQEVSHAIDRGASIITVDPRFSTVASKSKHWLPIRPSTDIALLLAWMHVIIYEDLYDKKYVEQYAYGFDELKAHVASYTPEWAYTKTDIKPEDIRKSAYEMAKAAPSVIIHPGRHTAWYGDDTQRMRSIAILNALLGSYGKKGGYYFAEKAKLPSYPHPEYPHPHWTWKDLTKKDGYKGAIAGVTNVIREASLPGAKEKYGHEYKGWFIVATNLIQSVPDQEKTIKALQNLDLVVVVDTMPMEITGYADVILPEATYLERYDVARVAQHRVPNIALRMPAAEPKWDTKPAWWMCRELGLKLGLEDYYKWETYEEVLDWQFKKVGSSLDEMKQIGVKLFDKKKKLYLDDGEDYFFNTNTGKIELYSTDLEAMGYDPMPKYTDHAQPEDGFYRLIYGRAPMHTFGRTINSPNMNDLMDENNIWINPKIAKIWDFKSGQEIWLQNQDGVISTFPIKIRVTERIRHDSVFMVHGFGHKNKKLTRAYGKGASDSEMISSYKIDPVTGGTGMRGNFVTFLTENPHKKEQV
ncbi:MAG: molybdopterin-dependent oxidoreductase [Bacteroidota bacterium]